MTRSATSLSLSPRPSSFPLASSGFKRAALDSSPRAESVHAVAGRPWSSEEVNILTENCQLGHDSQWKELSKLLPGRSVDACRRKHKILFLAKSPESGPIVRFVRLGRPSVSELTSVPGVVSRRRRHRLPSTIRLPFLQDRHSRSQCHRRDATNQ